MNQTNGSHVQMHPSVVEIVIVRPFGQIRQQQQQRRNIGLVRSQTCLQNGELQAIMRTKPQKQSYFPPLQGSLNNPSFAQALHSASLPLVVVRGSDGRVIQTDTIWQRLLALARMRVATGMPMVEAEDWRLPHVHAPAKPDYSRFMPFTLRRYFTSSGVTNRHTVIFCYEL